MSQELAHYTTHSEKKTPEDTHNEMGDSEPLHESRKETDMTIHCRINKLKPKHIFHMNGCNSQSWEQWLCLIFDSYLQDALYLQKGMVGNDKHERFFPAILLSSVPDSIQDSIITIQTCHVIYAWLKMHYVVMTRSSQCVAFNKLQDDEAPSSLVRQLDKALTELKN
ncbi:hypothetical protein O181_006623 [Austropuccinia psidii MF-1]|uniref:Uncharacterized protein n=1 Tax=Austropuccinia psidii MF-1 TaxID=1389203 RepID=A0A9Q3BKK0_9BASI|nr:hypothetical protein [Austropuccinia psidii MF-1]